MALAIEERVERRDEAGATPPGMTWIPGGTFRMGSERHYPEKAPTHRVAVDGFFVDRMPVTNREFRWFVNATGRTIAAATARRRAMPRRSTPRPAISAFALSTEQGAPDEQQLP
jgi:formylglycine-generating enzyme required for sulfatase activity